MFDGLLTGYLELRYIAHVYNQLDLYANFPV